ncbi:MAG: hypothetical protein AB7D36_10840, partial [Oscillospiraceae bacterium]
VVSRYLKDKHFCVIGTIHKKQYYDNIFLAILHRYSWPYYSTQESCIAWEDMCLFPYAFSHYQGNLKPMIKAGVLYDSGAYFSSCSKPVLGAHLMKIIMKGD